MVALDRWALARTRSLQAEIVEAYRDYAFHLIYQKIHNFCIVDLGRLLSGLIKDRLYTTPADGAARRSAQTAMYHIAESHGALARAHPVVHGRGDLARTCRATRGESVFLAPGTRCRALPRSDDRLAVRSSSCAAM